MIWWSRSRFFPLFSSALLFAGCATHSPSQIGGARKGAVAEDVTLAHDFFLRAQRMEMDGNSAVALGYYQIAFGYNSSNRDLCFLLLDRLRDAGKLDSAIALGKTCFTLQGKPTSGQYQSLGQAYLQKDDATSALPYYREAVRLDDEDRDALYILAGLYERLRDAKSYVETLRRLLPQIEYPPRLVDKLLQGYQALGQADSIGPILREAWQRTGQSGFGEELSEYYQIRSQPVQFLEVAEQLSRQNPDNRSYALLHAQALRGAGMPDSALAVYRELLERHPEDHETQFTYAVLLQQQGKTEESYAIFKKLSRAFPQSALYQFSYGSAGLESHKSECLIALEKAVSLEPSIPDYWARLIYAEHVFGRDSIAAEKLAHLPGGDNPGWQGAFFTGLVHVMLARQLEPRDSHPIGGDSTLLKDSLSARNYRRVAGDHYRIALEKSPGNHLVMFELGSDLERLGRRDSAAKILRELVKTDTMNAVAMNYLGYMLVEDGADLNYAGRLLDRALALEPSNGAFLDSKGWWYYRKGDYRSARIALQKSLEHMPSDPTVLEHLATVLDRLGDKEGASALRKKIPTVNGKPR